MGNAIKTETCANCGETIGVLEMPMVWKEHVVCGTCYKKLSVNNAPAPNNAPVEDVVAGIEAEMRSRPLTLEEIAQENARHLKYSDGSIMGVAAKGGIICPNPNCGYRGYPTTKPKKDGRITGSLAFFTVTFGILGFLDAFCFLVSFFCFVGWLGYGIFAQGEAKHCPRCGMKAG